MLPFQILQSIYSDAKYTGIILATNWSCLSSFNFRLHGEKQRYQSVKPSQSVTIHPAISCDELTIENSYGIGPLAVCLVGGRSVQRTDCESRVQGASRCHLDDACTSFRSRQLYCSSTSRDAQSTELSWMQRAMCCSFIAVRQSVERQKVNTTTTTTAKAKPGAASDRLPD